MTAIDQIVDNSSALKLTDAAGNAEKPGTLPRSLRQFSEAIDQTKTHLFQKFDALAQQTGQMGVVIDLRPIVGKYREIANDPVVASQHPSFAADLMRKADALERHGADTPSQMQKRIKLINNEWSSFYENKQKALGDVFEPIAAMHRELLDSAISNATTPGYQALKHQYGALRSIENDVTAATSRELAKKPGLLNRMADVATTHQVLMGVATLNPTLLASAGATQISKAAVKYLNDPNRAIERLFQRRAFPPPPRGRSLDPYMTAGVRAGAFDMGNNMAAPGGGFPRQADPIIGRRSITRPVQDQASQ